MPNNRKARTARISRVSLPLLLSAALAACGGGDAGGGGGGGGGGTSLSLDTTALSFHAFTYDQTQATQTIHVSWSGSAVAGYVVGTLPGEMLPTWLSVTAQGNSSPSSIIVSLVGATTIPGHYSTTLRVATGDINANVLKTADFTVSLDVVATPSVSPQAGTLTWVESEQPAAQTFSATWDPGVQFTGASVDVPWLTASVNGGTVTVSGNAQSQTVAAGPATGTLHTTFTYGGQEHTVDTPLSGTVTRALSGPAQIALEVNASTGLADLAGFRATISSATQNALQISAQSDAPWLAASGGMTGAANNVSLALDTTSLQQLADGMHAATITITAPGNISALQIPVVLNVRLPEVQFVAPVAFSDTVATDYVIVRGHGLNDPAAHLQLAGQPISGGTVVSDSEVRFVPGARAAGSYVVQAANNLGLTRSSASLRVADPPNYSNYSLSVVLGSQEHIVSSPINAMVFSAACAFVSCYTIGDPSVVHRFIYDAASGTWTTDETAFTNLIDIALSPDESTLLVLTSTQLLQLDPATMSPVHPAVTLPTFPPGNFSGNLLAVLNDGLVIVGQTYGFDLTTQQFVDVAGLASYFTYASRDGSRAINGDAVNNGSVAYRYFDASTNSVVMSDTRLYLVQAEYDRHATKAVVSANVFDADLNLLGPLQASSYIGDISPDGTRFYNPDFTLQEIHVFDLTTSGFPELTPILAPNMAPDDRIVLDPRGQAAFATEPNKFVVIDLR
ncbi:MAG TPA: hypothetical protein VLW26_04420 [Steroidobacteraceae bacterium]|nr:hypothetical protein [Steroidobacteraceae bacterium]